MERTDREVDEVCANDVEGGLFLHVTCTSTTSLQCVIILCHCTLAAALYFEQSSCDELMEFKQIQMRAQPEESLKHNHLSPRTWPL